MLLDESARLRALNDLGLLNSAPRESFDRITRMASQIFDVPIAAVSLTDRDRQWFKSRVGCGTEIPRDKAPCAEVTRMGDVLVVSDLSNDIRFQGGKLDQDGVRFYAGRRSRRGTASPWGQCVSSIPSRARLPPSRQRC